METGYRHAASRIYCFEIQTVICCANDAYLGEEWAGRLIDNKFISDLPANVDPCGENGEYHTFVLTAHL